MRGLLGLIVRRFSTSSPRSLKPQQRKGMKTVIDILTHPTDDCQGSAITLQTVKGHKYVLGQFSEGLQRSLNQHKNRMGKLKGVFLTGRVDWKSVGGLPGFLLTVTEQGAKSLRLQSAGNNLTWGANSWRNFMFHNMADLQIAHPSEVFRDEFVAIAPVVLPPDHAHQVPSFVPQQLKNSLEQQPDTTQDQRSSCFIVQVLPSRGKFMPAKAKQLGVKPGSAFGKLTNGETVTTETGTVVTPEMVMEEPKVPPRVLVVDIPTNAHVQAAIETEWTQAVSENTKVDIRVVYHFLGSEVAIDERYQGWVESFGPNCMHYICHPRYFPNGIMMESAAGLNSKLRHHLPTSFSKFHSSDSMESFEEQDNVKLGYALTTTVLEPEVRHVPDRRLIRGFVDQQQLQQDQEIPEKVEPQLITLGTGSAIPSKYRNVLGSILRVPVKCTDSGKEKWSSVVLDCGEGSFGTMRRVFGPEKTLQVLREINLVYISHLHADHHLGATTMIREWMKANDRSRPLFVLAPKQYKLFLDEWCQLEQDIDMDRMRILDAETYVIGQGYQRTESPPPSPKRNGPLSKALQAISGIYQIKTCRAFHCEWSYSVSFAFTTATQGSFKMSFSGDTRPNEFFARRVGLNSDLLLHEATHDNDLAEEAKRKRHSTIGEALHVASEMRAKATVLTHFSQRYPKLPELGSSVETGEAAFAFDGMQLYLSDIGLQKDKFGALQEVLAEVDQDSSDDEV